MKEEEDDKTTKEKLYEVFKELIILVETPEMRKRTLNVFYSWLVVAMVYYGLSFNTKNLGGNRYVSVFISGFVEVRNDIQSRSVTGNEINRVFSSFRRCLPWWSSCPC